MARRTPTTSRPSVRTSAPAAEGTSAAPGADSSIENSLAIVTAILLLAAIILLDYFHGTRYAGGMFFK